MPQAGEVLDGIMAKKKLMVATDANWPPQSFINDNNEMDGFDVDVARARGVEISLPRAPDTFLRPRLTSRR